MNDGYTYRELIDRRSDGRPVDAYLSERYTHSTLAEWREHLGAGRVQLDGVTARADTVLREGQALEYHRAPWREPSAPLEFTVLYEDIALVVVGKPAGLPTIPGGGFLQNTLLHQLQLRYPNASPTHRLGRWTSGAVLCARSAAAGADIAAQFANRSIDKRYRALASGVPTRDDYAIDTPIGPVPYPPLGTLHASDAGGRRASSRVTVIERRASAFLCDVTIATGRPHQIRIHLASIGHPLLGDPLYASGGLPVVGGDALPGDPGYQLHSAELGFLRPETRERLVVRAPPPALLRVSAGSPPERPDLAA